MLSSKVIRISRTIASRPTWRQATNIQNQFPTFPSSLYRFQSSRSTPSPNLRQSLSRTTYNSSSSSSNNNGRRSNNNPTGIPLWIWIGIGMPIAGLTTIYYSYLDQVPLTHRRRWIATSPEWERQLGDYEYQQLLKQFHDKILPDNHRATITVKRVGHRIYKAAKAFCQEHSVSSDKVDGISQPPTFTVVRSDMANAFVLPNNHVFVMTGLFAFARDEDELASVLGHEMAHNLARHVGEKVSGSLVVQILARLSLLLDPSGTLMLIFLPTANLLRELPHSRIQELEADQIGMHLAAKACYDPAAAQRVFQRMKHAASERSGSHNHQHHQPPQFLSTHPSHESRIAKMGEWLPETKAILERDGGETCREMRDEMVRARRIAAQRAMELEWEHQRQRQQQQQQQHLHYPPFR